MFFSASDTEVLLDDSEMLYEKLKKQGHQTALDVVFRTLEEWA